jgi:ABC-2 type transport system ATP-binding protein
MTPAVEVESLGKDFPLVRGGLDWLRLPFAHPSKRVLNEVSFAVVPGEVFGLLGPNGAGKTTLLKILSTLLEPSTGRAALAGCDVVRQSAAARRQLGYCPGFDRAFYLRLSARENLRFYGALNNLRPRTLTARIGALLAALGLEDKRDEPVRNFSTGMLQRLAIARALLHQPRVLILDEPTRSLDPTAAAWLRRHLREELAGRQGATVLVATHNLTEAEETCHRLGVLDQGRLQAVGTAKEVCRQAGVASLAEAYARLTTPEKAPEEVSERR